MENTKTTVVAASWLFVIFAFVYNLVGFRVALHDRDVDRQKAEKKKRDLDESYLQIPKPSPFANHFYAEYNERKLLEEITHQTGNISEKPVKKIEIKKINTEVKLEKQVELEAEPEVDNDSVDAQKKEPEKKIRDSKIIITRRRDTIHD